jgi:hypothetical protein
LYKVVHGQHITAEQFADKLAEQLSLQRVLMDIIYGELAHHTVGAATRPVSGDSQGTGGGGRAPESSSTLSTPRRIIRVPSTGTTGSQRQSVRTAELRGLAGKRGQKPPRALTAKQQEMKKLLMDEHSKDGPPLDSSVADDALQGAASVKGAHGKGADVVLVNGGGREVAVYSGKFHRQGLNSKLVQEASQKGTTEVYLQIKVPNANRTELIKMITTPEGQFGPLRRGNPSLSGKNIRFYSADGKLWWSGKFF